MAEIGSWPQALSMESHEAPWVRERPADSSAPSGDAPRLMNRVRSAVRLCHYSRRTEKAYSGWIRRFILFHGKRHAAEMGEPEVSRFLSHLAVQGKVSASTQNQAFSTLLLLYRDVLAKERDRPGRVSG